MKTLILFLATWASLGSSHAEINTDKMVQIQNNLNALLSDISSDEIYRAPENRKRIEKELKSFSESTHEIRSGKSETNPTLPVMSEHLLKQSEKAYRAFTEGNREYARQMVRSSIQFCIACHTKDSSGPQIFSLYQLPAGKLRTLEAAQFYSATRQYDQAITEYLRILEQPEKTQLFAADSEDAARQALAIAVRVKKDPKLALRIIDAVIQSKDAPVFLKIDALGWKHAVARWKIDWLRNEKAETTVFFEIEKLLQEAQHRQKYSTDHSTDLYYLRASTFLYYFIQTYPKSKKLAEALFLQGICYEALNLRELENLNEVFFEACIQTSPHSKISEKCYQHYEHSIYQKFSGASGVILPQAVKIELMDLRMKAVP